MRFTFKNDITILSQSYHLALIMKIILLLSTFFLQNLIFVSTSMHDTAKAQQLDIIDLDRIDADDPLIKAENDKDKKSSVKINFTGFDSGKQGFKFTVSPLLITYDQFSPTNPIIRENIISFHNTSSVPFFIYAQEDGALRDKEGNFIPDTNCDNGACTENVSAVWLSTLTYGFGYRCIDIKGLSCSSEFGNNDYFKQLSNSGAKENHSNLAKGLSSNVNYEMKINYKVNTAASQIDSIYSNTITFTALPGY